MHSSLIRPLHFPHTQTVSPGIQNLSVITSSDEAGREDRLSISAGSSSGGSDSGRRISLGAKEADLTSQVAGLKTLLARKNAELESLKTKADEGVEAIKSEKVLKERTEKAEKERDEIKARVRDLEVRSGRAATRIELGYGTCRH